MLKPSSRPLTLDDLALVPDGGVIVAWDFTDPMVAVRRLDNRWSVAGYKMPYTDAEVIEMGGEWELAAVRRDGS